MPKITLKTIFEATEIMLHPRHNPRRFKMSYSDRRVFGAAVKDRDTWRFEPEDGNVFAPKNLHDVGTTLEMLNEYDPCSVTDEG